MPIAGPMRHPNAAPDVLVVNNLTIRQTDRILAMRHRGWHMAPIARDVGCRVEDVRRVLVDAGMKP